MYSLSLVGSDCVIPFFAGKVDPYAPFSCQSYYTGRVLLALLVTYNTSLSHCVGVSKYSLPTIELTREKKIISFLAILFPQNFLVLSVDSDALLKTIFELTRNYGN